MQDHAADIGLITGKVRGGSDSALSVAAQGQIIPPTPGWFTRLFSERQRDRMVIVSTSSPFARTLMVPGAVDAQHEATLAGCEAVHPASTETSSNSRVRRIISLTMRQLRRRFDWRFQYLA